VIKELQFNRMSDEDAVNLSKELSVSVLQCSEVPPYTSIRSKLNTDRAARTGQGGPEGRERG
jgi:hypothetical protein